MESLPKKVPERGAPPMPPPPRQQSPEEVAKRLWLTDLSLSAYEFQEKNPEIAYRFEHYIESVDRQEVAAIFQEFYIRSGIQTPVSLTPTDRTFIIEGENTGVLMSYIPQFDTITMSAKSLESYFIDSLFNEGQEQMAFLHSYIHELTHAAGHLSASEERDQHENKIELKKREFTGVKERLFSTCISKPDNKIVSEDVYDLFLLLNEGITERIADEVLAEYRKRHGKLGDAAVSHTEVLQAPERRQDFKGGTYALAERVVGSLVTAMAQEIQIPEEVVWRGFERQYFSGELYKNISALGYVLLAMFGEDLVSKLAFAKNTSDLYEAALGTPALAKEFSTAVEKWAEHLHLARGAQ